MADVRYKPNRKAFGEIVKSPETVHLVGSCAARIAAAAGPGHSSNVVMGRRRPHAEAFTTSGLEGQAAGGAEPLASAIGAGRV